MGFQSRRRRSRAEEHGRHGDERGKAGVQSEFFDRLDEVDYFHPLGDEICLRIIDLLVGPAEAIR